MVGGRLRHQKKLTKAALQGDGVNIATRKLITRTKKKIAQGKRKRKKPSRKILDLRYRVLY